MMMMILLMGSEERIPGRNCITERKECNLYRCQLNAFFHGPMVVDDGHMVKGRVHHSAN